MVGSSRSASAYPSLSSYAPCTSASHWSCIARNKGRGGERVPSSLLPFVLLARLSPSHWHRVWVHRTCLLGLSCTRTVYFDNGPRVSTSMAMWGPHDLLSISHDSRTFCIYSTITTCPPGIVQRSSSYPSHPIVSPSSSSRSIDDSPISGRVLTEAGDDWDQEEGGRGTRRNNGEGMGGRVRFDSR